MAFSQPYRIEAGPFELQAENIDTMFEDLYQQLDKTFILGQPGEITYISLTNTLISLPVDLTTPKYLSNTGGNGFPAWTLVDVASGVTGTLAAIHGGTDNAIYVLGDILYANSTTTLTRLAGNITSTQMFLTQTGAGGLSAAPSWQIVPSIGSLVYWFYKTASDIATYFQMKTPASTGGDQTIVTLNMAAGDTLLASFATLSGVPNVTFVPAGTCTCYVTANRTAGSNVVQLFARFYQRNLAGTETLLATSALSDLLTADTDVAYIFQGAIPTAVTFLATDRLVTKIYAHVISGGATHDVELTIEGVTAARSESPSATVDATNFVPYIGATANVALGTFSLTVPLVIGGTAVASTLTLKSTSGVGTTDAIIFQVGNNGATEAMRVLTSGVVTFGGSTSSFPALKRSSTTLQVRLADDSADAFLSSRAFTVSEIAGPFITHTVRGRLDWNSDGDLKLFNAAGTIYTQWNTNGIGWTADNAILRNGPAKFLFSNEAATIGFHLNGGTANIMKVQDVAGTADAAITASGLTLSASLDLAATSVIRWGSTSSFPLLKRSTTEVQVRLGDDSDYTAIHVQNTLYKAGAGVGMVSDSLGSFTFNADGQMKIATAAAGGRVLINGPGGIQWQDGDNVIVPNGSGILFFANFAQNAFNRIQFGDTGTAGPSLKRSTTDLHIRLANDSAYSNLGLAKIVIYNSLTTVSGGIPSELATIDSTGLTANVGATTLYAVPASGEGMYRVSAYVVETTAASVSSTLPNVQVVYTDKDSNTSVTLDVTPILGIAGIGQTGALTANTVGTLASGTVPVFIKASTTIQYQTVNYASTIAGMTYALRIKLEAM